MTEQERKGLKVGDEIRAIKEYPRDTDWVVGDVFKIDELHRNGDPHFIAGKGKGWYISKNMENIHCFEVVHETSEGLRKLKKGEKALVISYSGGYDIKKGDLVTITRDGASANVSSDYVATNEKIGDSEACFSRNDLLAIRDEVVRGPDWGYDDQDKGDIGIVKRFLDNPYEGFNLAVQWKQGGEKHYRMNADYQDLKPTGNSEEQVKEEELTTDKGPQVGGKIIVISDTGGNHTPGSVHKLTSTSALEDSMQTANGTLYDSEFFTIGDLVYKHSIAGKIIAIHRHTSKLNIQWKPNQGICCHNIMKDGQLQWKKAPEGVGWGENINDHEGRVKNIDVDGEATLPCFGEFDCHPSLNCDQCGRKLPDGCCPCATSIKGKSCLHKEACEHEKRGCSAKVMMTLEAEDKCSKFIPSDLRRECKNHEPITNEEDTTMATSETFNRLQRAKEIEMTDLPVATHEEAAAKEKKIQLADEMDRLLNFPTILSEKEFLLSKPAKEWTGKDTMRAIELGLPVNINIENVNQ